MFVHCSNSSCDILVAAHQNTHTQTVIDATQKETAIYQQQQSCETLICQRHQTILRLPRQAHSGEFANFIVRSRTLRQKPVY